MVERKYRPLRRSEPFSFRAERMPALAAESRVSPLSPVRYGWKQRRLSRGISAFSKLELKPTDCVAEPSQFELSGDFRSLRKKQDSPW
jgi:hypothetical protein